MSKRNGGIGTGDLAGEPGQLLYEFRVDQAGPWRRLATLWQADPPGSISNHSRGPRDVILFRCCGPYSLIERSLAGADFEAATSRIVATEGTEVLATLHDGDSYELDVHSDGGRQYSARWTHLRP